MKKKIIIILALVIAALAYYYGANTYKGEMAVEKVADVVMEKNNENGQENQKNDGEVIGKEDIKIDLGDNQIVVKKEMVVSKNDGKITIAELAKHNNDQDCWIVYKNSVYDVTKFLPIHPGGSDKIAHHCGASDFEKHFEKQHGTSKVDMLKSKAGQLQGEI